MRTYRRPPLALRASVIAVHGALALFATVAQAQSKGPSFSDPAVQELVQPTNTIEAGAIYVDKASAKFGEFNGLQRDGTQALLGFQLRGGGAYNPESGSVRRWSVFGKNLGLDVREVGGQYAEQGLFRIGLGYDELRRNAFDSFTTIWNGAGSTTLTLPAGYPAPATRGTAGANNFNNTQSANMAAALQGALHSQNLFTERKRYTLAGEVNLTPQWTLGVNARTEKKEGTKLTGIAFGGFRGAFAPEPVDSTTDIVETVARYTTKDAQLGIGFNVSRFRNNVDFWTAENPFANNVVPNNRALLVSAPDNLMTQFTLDGAYRFSPTVKVTVAGSRALLRQDEQFFFQPGTVTALGDTSARAREVQTNLLARLTYQPSPVMDLNAAYRYEHRDNQTPTERAFSVRQAEGPTSAPQTFNSLAIDRKVQTASLDGSYRYRNGGVATGGYEHQRVERSTGGTMTARQEDFASNRSDEDTLRVGYRQALTPTVNGQVGLAHSRRRADGYRDAETNAQGFFTSTPGFRQFFLNDRDRNKLRGSLDFQASDELSLQVNAELLDDRFPGGTFGTRKAKSQMLNFEGTYAASEKLSFNGYVTYEDADMHQDQQQIIVGPPQGTDRANPTPGVCNPYTPAAGLTTPPSAFVNDSCRQWGMTQTDKVWTLGLGTKSTQFLGGKLTLTGDVLYSRARTNIGFAGGTFFSTGTQNVFIPAQAMPTITSYLTELRFGARYALDKASSVKFGWVHQRLRSSDAQFDLFGFNSVQGFVGPGIRSPRHNVNAVSVSYVYSFQ